MPATRNGNAAPDSGPRPSAAACPRRTERVLARYSTGTKKNGLGQVAPFTDQGSCSSAAATRQPAWRQMQFFYSIKKEGTPAVVSTRVAEQNGIERSEDAGRVRLGPADMVGTLAAAEMCRRAHLVRAVESELREVDPAAYAQIRPVAGAGQVARSTSVLS